MSADKIEDIRPIITIAETVGEYKLINCPKIELPEEFDLKEKVYFKVVDITSSLASHEGFYPATKDVVLKYKKEAQEIVDNFNTDSQKNKDNKGGSPQKIVRIEDGALYGKETTNNKAELVNEKVDGLLYKLLMQVNYNDQKAIAKYEECTAGSLQLLKNTEDVQAGQYLMSFYDYDTQRNNDIWKANFKKSIKETLKNSFEANMYRPAKSLNLRIGNGYIEPNFSVVTGAEFKIIPVEDIVDSGMDVVTMAIL